MSHKHKVVIGFLMFDGYIHFVFRRKNKRKCAFSVSKLQSYFLINSFETFYMDYKQGRTEPMHFF